MQRRSPTQRHSRSIRDMGDEYFVQTSVHKTKHAARRRAVKIRNDGEKARIAKTKFGWGVFEVA